MKSTISLLVVLGLCLAASFPQKEAKQRPPKWDVLRFGGKLDDGNTYSIRKLIVDVPVNKKQACFGPVKGIFENDETAFDKLEISDSETLKLLEGSFASFFRLRQNMITSYGQPGKVTVVTNNGQFEITISELGFNLGNGYPSQKNTFFSWTLAKILDDEARKLGKSGLKKKHFEVLSGTHWIESSKSRYSELQARRETDENAR